MTVFAIWRDLRSSRKPPAEGGGIVIGNLTLAEIVYGILWPIGCENPHTPIIR